MDVQESEAKFLFENNMSDWLAMWGLGIGQWTEKQLVTIVVMMIIDYDQRLKNP